MNGVLSPAGIFTNNNIYKDITEFYKTLLYDREETFKSNTIKNYRPGSDIENLKEYGYIIFINDKSFFFASDDSYHEVVFPIDKQTNTYFMTIYQLRFLQNCNDILSMEQEFIINNFLLKTNYVPISSNFVTDECLECIKKNSNSDIPNYKDIKSMICIKCINCDTYKYNNKIKLMCEFTSNNQIEIKSNKEKMLEYKKNNNHKIINMSCEYKNGTSFYAFRKNYIAFASKSNFK